MLMEIDPLWMRGSLVMTMALIFPSQREVCPTESLHQRAKVLLPRFHLETVALHHESFLMIFPGQKTPYTRRWASRGFYMAHEARGAPRG